MTEAPLGGPEGFKSKDYKESDNSVKPTDLKKSSESNPASSLENKGVFERKNISEVIFEEIKDKDGRVQGYKSSAKDRKRIVLGQGSPRPILGFPYEVAVVNDTKPNDPMSGVYEVEIVSGQRSQLSEEEWQEIENRVLNAEDGERIRRQGSTDLYRRTDIPSGERSAQEEDESFVKRIGGDRLASHAYERMIVNQSIVNQMLGPADSFERELVAFQRKNLLAAFEKNRELEDRKSKLLDEEVKILKTSQRDQGLA